MKNFFIESRYRNKIDLPKSLIDKLPKNIILFTSVQFLDSIEDIKQKITKSGRKVKILKLNHCKYQSQLLGCSIQKIEEEFDAFLYIGDGQFHPKALVIKNNKPVFVYNPFNGKDYSISLEDVNTIRKKINGGLAKFLSSNNVGILISSKKGQYKVKDIKELKEKYKDKNFYLFLFDTLDFSSLEDFNFIEIWVNTACPRIIDDYDKFRKLVVNIEDILELE